jgi:hypothetical protein
MNISSDWTSSFQFYLHPDGFMLIGFTSFRLDFLIESRKNIHSRCNVEIKVGDIYIRHSNKRAYRVKKIDNKMVILQLMNERQLCLTNIFALEKRYTKVPKST